MKNYFGREKEIIHLNDLRVEASNRLIEESESIIGSQTRELRNEKIELVLAKWKRSSGSDQTWETKEEIKK